MRLSSFGWLCLLLLFLPCTTQAQTLLQEKKLARKLYRQGKAFAMKRQFDDAVDRYKQALLVIRRAEGKTTTRQEKREWLQRRLTLLYIIGRTYHFNKEWPLALRFYRRCLASGPKPKVERQVKRFLAEILPKVQVTLFLKTVPARAQITVTTTTGEQRGGRSPFLTQMEPGRVRIRISLKGYQSQEHSFRLVTGIRFERKFRLLRKVILPSLVVRKSPNNTKTSNSGLSVRRPKPPKPVPLREIGLWGGVGLAVTGVIVGGVLLGMAAGDFQQASEMKGNANFQTQQVIDKIDSGNSRQAVGFVFLLLGLGGAGSAVYFGLQPPTTKTTSLSSEPRKTLVLSHP